MPFMKNGKRDYKKQYEKYDGKPSVKKDRAKRNAARREYERRNGDLPSDVEVDHKRPLSKGGGNSKSNLRAVKRSNNRSFKRKKDGSMK